MGKVSMHAIYRKNFPWDIVNLKLVILLDVEPWIHGIDNVILEGH